jgi:hypothetical protein
MIEIYYRKPASPRREQAIGACVSEFDGKVTYRENDSDNSICVTVEFGSWESAKSAITKLRAAGEHVEGPVDYGDD